MNNKDREIQQPGRVWRMNSAGEFVCTNEEIKIVQATPKKKQNDNITHVNDVEMEMLFAELEKKNREHYFDLAIDDALANVDKARFEQLMKQMMDN